MAKAHIAYTIIFNSCAVSSSNPDHHITCRTTALEKRDDDSEKPIIFSFKPNVHQRLRDEMNLYDALQADKAVTNKKTHFLILWKFAARFGFRPRNNSIHAGEH